MLEAGFMLILLLDLQMLAPLTPQKSTVARLKTHLNPT